jgi:ubiquinone/menaquinone biosynthesis C-methylase UbiE
MNVTWDYTDLASHYDKRADYSAKALDRLCAALGVGKGAAVADIGAGTGKLAVPLARRGYRVSAVEPNAAMRAFGARNTEGLGVVWAEGAGERTRLPSGAFDFVTFGSSFNVVDQTRALAEVVRLLKPSGSLACMWNHRDLDDPAQTRIEAIIRNAIPGYGYGKRREDPTPVIDACGAFGPVSAIEERFVVEVSLADFVEAWRSHGTLQRQAAGKFASIIDLIEAALSDKKSLSIPYFTHIWHARRVREAL